MIPVAPSRVSCATSIFSLSRSRLTSSRNRSVAFSTAFSACTSEHEVHPTLQVEAEVDSFRSRQDSGKQGRQTLDGTDAGDDVVPCEQRGDNQQNDATSDPLSHRKASKNDTRAKALGAWPPQP